MKFRVFVRLFGFHLRGGKTVRASLRLASRAFKYEYN